ncbi:MAG: cytochrome c biogenesis protein CcsA [Firmicutes bacterium]|nr:cytochrome c biogenesis protein CcsA [Bacillota bacterium]
MTALILPLLVLVLVFYLTAALLYLSGVGTVKGWVSRTATLSAAAGGICNLAVLVTRGVIAERLPLASGSEFLLIFIFLTVSMYLLYELKSGGRKAGGVVMLIAALLALSVLLMRGQLYEVSPLMPALKSPWLAVHVLTAALSYAGFALAAGMAIMHLVRPGNSQLEANVYRAAAGGFAMLSLSIVLGAIWAEQAWGSYWTWDPKETWALITWIIYAVYLHLHRRPGWRGKNASGLVIVGFILVLFTFFGVNYLMSGLHSYS